MTKLNWYEEAEKYKDVRTKLNRHIKAHELNKNVWGLRSSNWYVINSPIRSIKNYTDFILWCGFPTLKNLSKQDVIAIIYEMQSKINHPIDIDDFKNPQANEIGIRIVWKHWGSISTMQKELGLEVTNRNVNVDKRINDCKNKLLILCEYIYKTENRRCISYDDIRKCEYLTDPRSITVTLKSCNTTLRDFINDNGFKLIKAGCGLTHTFDDGEKVFSSYEFEFSKYLKSLGFVYGKDYNKDILYTNIDSSYTGRMTCDYWICINGKSIYVEIAGMLAKKLHEKSYIEKMKIDSKSKEKYRQILEYKKSIMCKQGVCFYVILPSQINDESYKNIILRFVENKSA